MSNSWAAKVSVDATMMIDVLLQANGGKKSYSLGAIPVGLAGTVVADVPRPPTSNQTMSLLR